jgi:hypothetical protein
MVHTKSVMVQEIPVVFQQQMGQTPEKTVIAKVPQVPQEKTVTLSAEVGPMTIFERISFWLTKQKTTNMTFVFINYQQRGKRWKKNNEKGLKVKNF